MLARSISYTPPAGFSEVILLHSSDYALLVSSFCYTPRTGFSEEFLVTHRAGFSEEFLLHSLSWF